MVELPNGKMKSREGTVVDADELMDEMIDGAREMSKERNTMTEMTDEERENVFRIIGLGALKYFILKVDPRKNMLFNPQESIDFNGNTGPFVQYTYARIQSLLRKSEQGDARVDFTAYEPNEKEIELIQRLTDFAAVVTEAGRTYSPALVANYVFELSKSYNQFYHDYSILKEEDAVVRAFRLSLSRTVARMVARGFSLLGIEVPERM